MKIYSTLIRSLVTEKSSMLQSKGQYSFEVRRDATKIDVKNAVKAIYGVDVEKVTISILPKKTRLFGKGKVMTKRPVTKKAIVKLKGGKTIDPFKVKETKK
jgi:large subunit ribosomal protein L23